MARWAAKATRKEVEHGQQDHVIAPRIALLVARPRTRYMRP